MSGTICVYASSSEALAEAYFEAAGRLGRRIGERGYSLVYGGGRLGLMGAVARATQAGGGRVIGVIPEKLLPQGNTEVDEMIVTGNMRDRKAMMEARADAFIVLPGGFGTLEEALEILTLKQLGYHAKPVVLFNTAGFFAPLRDVFEHLYAEHFAHPAYRALYHLTADADEALDYIAAYRPPILPDKAHSTSRAAG